MLTEIAIRNLKPKPARYEKPDGKGLYVVVHPTGRKSYAVRFRVNGKPKKLTLRRGISLAEARAEAAAARLRVDQGHDPAVTKREAKEAQRIAAANTFKVISERYLEQAAKKKESERLRSLEWRRALLKRLVFPTLGTQPITKIKRKAIIDLLDNIEFGKLVDDDGERITGGPVMAQSTLAVVRSIMNWYAVRDEEYVVPIVRGMARIKPASRARTRVLNDDELRAVWKTADKRADPFAALVQFLLLTAARRTEAAGMTWDEVVDGEWLLPARRNKTKLELLRPLSKQARTILEARPRIEGCPFVFTYGRAALANYSQAKALFDGDCGVNDWTLHDLRRTARTLMSRAGVSSDVAEQCLGHVLPGIRRVYNRDDFRPQKKAAFEALVAQIERIVHPPVGNVTALPVRG
jgi:integrase